MQIEESKAPQKRRKPVSALKQKHVQSEPNGREIVDEITEAIGISEEALAAHLRVTLKTVQNWKKSTLSELAANSKSSRLVNFKSLVDSALQKKIPMVFMNELFVTPIDENDPTRKSILDWMVEEPQTKFFVQFSSLVIDRFFETLEVQKPAEIVLSKDEIQKVAKQLEKTPEPTEALVRAVTKHRKYFK